MDVVQCYRLLTSCLVLFNSVRKSTKCGHLKNAIDCLKSDPPICDHEWLEERIDSWRIPTTPDLIKKRPPDIGSSRALKKIDNVTSRRDQNLGDSPQKTGYTHKRVSNKDKEVTTIATSSDTQYDTPSDTLSKPLTKMYIAMFSILQYMEGLRTDYITSCVPIGESEPSTKPQRNKGVPSKHCETIGGAISCLLVLFLWLL